TPRQQQQAQSGPIDVLWEMAVAGYFGGSVPQVLSPILALTLFNQHCPQHAFKRDNMAVYRESRNDNISTTSDFLLIQAELEVDRLRKLGLSASGYIRTDPIRYNFLSNLEAFTEAQLECINSNDTLENKTHALHYLTLEQEYLDKQINWLQSRQVNPAVSVEIISKNGMLSYIVKSIGLIGGVLQVVSGGVLLLSGSPTVVGSVVGAALIVHGFNNILENSKSLFGGDDNYIGPATYLYGEAANLLGYDRAYG
ncbi:DUF4225 domain-containing protein, partial [Serratia marcescens]|uniref:DUF4225 domain-containing protein n=1 Tax=Serratia marcescens TaxID=615 RepID=UPI0011E896ED